MVRGALEPPYWRDDIREFISRPGSYAERFCRQLAWVNETPAAISPAMATDAVDQIGAAMLTHYPCIIAWPTPAPRRSYRRNPKLVRRHPDRPEGQTQVLGIPEDV